MLLSCSTVAAAVDAALPVLSLPLLMLTVAAVVVVVAATAVAVADAVAVAGSATAAGAAAASDYTLLLVGFLIDHSDLRPLKPFSEFRPSPLSPLDSDKTNEAKPSAVSTVTAKHEYTGRKV